MKVYVASKFENVGPVRAVYARLRAAGHTVTQDWTTETDVVSGALDDFHGVRRAEAFILLCYPGMRGSFVELGMALALDQFVVVVNRAACENVFFNLGPNRILHVATWEEAVAALPIAWRAVLP